MPYIDEILERVVSQNPAQPEFHQSVREVLESLRVVIEADEDRYRSEALLERLTTPERVILFRVPWVDDRGQVQINSGIRVQFSSAIGPYKGGLTSGPSVTLDTVKFMGFEQIFKNALTGLPLGGGMGGSDFDRRGKSEREVMAFCQSYINELFRHIGADTDIPACGNGIGRREVGLMYGQYKRLRNVYEGVFTCKRPAFGGTLLRTEATGYGVVYLTEELLRCHGMDLAGKTVSVSGAGNVAIYAIEKAQQLGAKVITCSESTGWIYDPAGSVRTDIALPCAAQNELRIEDARVLVANGVTAVCEGATMPTTPDAIRYLQENGVLFVPAKAANAGGVSSSALEMSQNAMRLSWTFEEVDAKLRIIMPRIYHSIDEAARQYGMEGNYVAGANIAGFLKVRDAMEAQGIV